MTLNEKDLLVPPKEIKKAYKELKKSGFVYSMAKDYKDIGKKKYPVRAVYSAPSLDLKDNEITLGPFPLSIEHYKHTIETLQAECNATDGTDAFVAYLGLMKLQYEKTGITGEDYHFSASDESLVPLLNLLAYFEIDNPYIGDNFVWFYPKEKCKIIVQNQKGKQPKSGDYSWWNAVVNLGADIKLTDLDDYPDMYSLHPTDLTAKWSKYLPHHVLVTLGILYMKYTVGGTLKPFGRVSVALKALDENIDKHKDQKEYSGSFPDRELLLKELYDYNGFDYPVDAKTMFDFLEGLGFIDATTKNNKAIYSLAYDLPDPKARLKFPKGWHDRAKAYLMTGTILFSYLDADEALK